MVIHLFAFRWKPDVTPAHKTRALSEIQALQGQIPGLLETFAGVNFSPRSQGHAFGGIMKFTDRAALEAYATHPAHQALLSWLMPLVDPLEIDFAI